MPRFDLPRIVLITLSFCVIVVLIGTETSWFGLSTVPSPCSVPTASAFHLTNYTSQLGPTFFHGGPQAFGFNGTETLVTGVAGDPGPSTVPFALLGAVGGTATQATPLNLSRQVAGLFPSGDTLGIAWNGTAWIITGEAAWGSYSTGAAAELSGGVWTNLTPRLGPYFSGQGGIWFDAWNGTAWLFGGASDAGASLVALRGGTVRDLSPLIPHDHAGDWIQFLSWNGTAWLVGGYGVFGALLGDRYVDLYPNSDFAHGGMFGAAWNGTAWLIGGGSPGRTEYLRGVTLTEAPPLSPPMAWWVNTIVWEGRGWYIGGEGATPVLSYQSVLEYLDAGTGRLVDLSVALPGSFQGGQVQFGAPAPFLGPGNVLFLGQGGLGSSPSASGESRGAATVILRVC